MPTIGDLFDDARLLLNDFSSAAGPVRYTDEDLMRSFNDGLLEARGRRPDAFLAMGLRIPVPRYAAPDDLGSAFPLDQIFYPLFVYYVAGRSELREDEFSNDSRAMIMVNRFSTGLILPGIVAGGAGGGG